MKYTTFARFRKLSDYGLVKTWKPLYPDKEKRQQPEREISYRLLAIMVSMKSCDYLRNELFAQPHMPFQRT